MLPGLYEIIRDALLESNQASKLELTMFNVLYISEVFPMGIFQKYYG